MKEAANDASAAPNLTLSRVPLTRNEIADLMVTAVGGVAGLGLSPRNLGGGWVLLDGTTPAHSADTSGSLGLSDTTRARTQEEVAEQIKSAVDAAGLGLTPTVLPDGSVHLGGADQTVDVSGTPRLTLSGLPGVAAAGANATMLPATTSPTVYGNLSRRAIIATTAATNSRISMRSTKCSMDTHNDGTGHARTSQAASR